MSEISNACKHCDRLGDIEYCNYCEYRNGLLIQPSVKTHNHAYHPKKIPGWIWPIVERYNTSIPEKGDHVIEISKIDRLETGENFVIKSSFAKPFELKLRPEALRKNCSVSIKFHNGKPLDFSTKHTSTKKPTRFNVANNPPIFDDVNDYV